MTQNKKNYRKTLNLPKTKFSMKANLVHKEPELRRQWAKNNIYAGIRHARKGKQLYILHDGPPYANGDIHMGHVINKVLKDIVIKYKTMKGFDAPYVPGWDCHGLPIESKVVGEIGTKASEMSKLGIRRRCMKYASRYLKLQSKQFQQLGIFGAFEEPYLTFKPQYEAGVLEIFAELVGKGLVDKQLKPIHWCPACQTALAEAELEYEDIESPSIYVNFAVDESSARRLAELGLVESGDKEGKVCLMIWTTTPWTLAANLAVAVNPSLEYTTITYDDDGGRVVSVVAKERVEAVISEGKLEEGSYKVSQKTVSGNKLKGLSYIHPFVNKNPTDRDAYRMITAGYITTEDGSGLVHIAPGHGAEDYSSSRQHNLAVYSPVDDKGRYDETVPEWLRGKSVLEVDGQVVAHLADKGVLFSARQVSHSYPHCWRSKTPVISRATEQWFVRVDKKLSETGESLRDMALQEVKKVAWVPQWGQKRIEGMLESRPDWCISRQRSWGLPVPAFVNSQGEALMTKQSVLAVSKHIGKKGSDSWFTDSPREILGEDFELPEGFVFEDLQKEDNILDVWFESGCSWYNTATKAGWPVPVDLYLEGSDQHRGWFQLSLLPALGSVGKAPFKSVLTHGFTVDEKGRKQSKSLGNYVNAQVEVSKYGSDILRLWVSSVNYQADMKCTDELVARTREAYRKIRNTLRYLLGNCSDFDSGKDAVAYRDMFEIDKWAVQQLQKLIVKVTEAYESFAFHRVFSLIYNFCTVEMSSIYMDVLKDRLYCDISDSLSRRSAQTAMHRILDSLVRMLAPILVHTTEEAWAAMGHNSQMKDGSDSVHIAEMPKVDKSIDLQSAEPKWQRLMQLRDKVLSELERLRNNQEIKSNQESQVDIYSDDDELICVVKDFGTDAFASLCIVSSVSLHNYTDEMRKENKADNSVPAICVAAKSSNKKCQRCWNYSPTVGADKDYPDLCRRCVDVVKRLQ